MFSLNAWEYGLEKSEYRHFLPNDISQNSSVETPFNEVNAFSKLLPFRDIYYGIERNRFQKVTPVVYLHIIFFRMHKRDAAIEKEFDTVLQMTPDHILTQGFKKKH